MGGTVTQLLSSADNSYLPSSPTQQFGVTLQFIKDNYNVTIPPVVKQCIEYLDQPDGNLMNDLDNENYIIILNFFGNN